MWAWLSSRILRNRNGILVVLGLITLFLGYEMKNVKLSYKFGGLLPKTDSAYVQYEELQARLLKWTYHAELPLAPAFIATIYPPSGLWINVFPNGSADPNTFGITGYFGTCNTPYGPGLLYNSVLQPTALCFPGMWDRFTLFREICKEHISLQEPYMITKEYVDVSIYQVCQIPIGDYPTGSVNHHYHFKVGLLVPG